MRRPPSSEGFDLGFLGPSDFGDTGFESQFLHEIININSDLKYVISTSDHIIKYQFDYRVFNLFYQQLHSTGFQDSDFFKNNIKKIEKLIDFEFNNRELVAEIIDTLTTKNGKCEFLDVTNSIDQFMQEISIYDQDFNTRHNLDSFENAYDLYTKSNVAKYFHKKSLLNLNPSFIQENIGKIKFFFDFEKFAPRAFDHILSKNDGDLEKTNSQSTALELMLLSYLASRDKYQNIENFFREYEKERIKQDESTASNQVARSRSPTMAQQSQTGDYRQLRPAQQLPTSSPANLSSLQPSLGNSFGGPRLT